MIYTKTDPVGADKCIQLWQQSLYDRLPAKWSISNTAILAFGRAELVKDKLYVFEGGIDYVQHNLLLDDRYSVQYFFLVRSRGYISRWAYETDLYFFVNLSDVSSLETRADEEVIQDIVDMFFPSEAFQSIGPADDLPGFKTEMNMHPWVAFKIKLNLT